ncbi:MAG TPA: M20/M25/M40 family metallo-hydrolase [Acidimicrobiia bacterium]
MGRSLRSEVEESHLLSGDYLAELTSRFVATPSVNGQHPERHLADVVRVELDTYGFSTELVGESETRPSLGAFFGDRDSEGTVLLNGHLDTVPVDDAELWEFDPFAGVIANGAVHGRGACDMKGGLAVQVAVAQWLARSAIGAEGLVLHFAMGEERGEPGTEDLIRAGFLAPFGVVLEPTDFKLGIAQRGLVTLQISLGGRAAHTSMADLGDNPVSKLPSVLAVLERLNAEAGRRHALLGGPVWTPTVVRAGSIPSMVPSRCDLLVDRRMIPGESVEFVVDETEAALRLELPTAELSVSVSLEEGTFEPAQVGEDRPIVGYMREALGFFGEPVVLFGTPYSSDVRHLVNSAGIDAVTWGPGRLAELHSRDESVAVGDLERAARILAAFCVMAAEQAL